MVKINAVFADGRNESFESGSEIGCIIKALDFADNNETEIVRYTIDEQNKQ